APELVPYGQAGREVLEFAAGYQVVHFPLGDTLEVGEIHEDLVRAHSGVPVATRQPEQGRRIRAAQRLREQDGNSLLLVLLGPELSPDKRAVLVGAFEHNAETRRPAPSARSADRVQENCQRQDSVPLTEPFDEGAVYLVYAILALFDPLDAQVVRITRRYEAHFPAPTGRPTRRGPGAAGPPWRGRCPACARRPR